MRLLIILSYLCDFCNICSHLSHNLFDLFFLVRKNKNCIDLLKESVSGFIDFLNCFCVLYFFISDFISIISFVLLTLYVSYSFCPHFFFYGGSLNQCCDTCLLFCFRTCSAINFLFNTALVEWYKCCVSCFLSFHCAQNTFYFPFWFPLLPMPLLRQVLFSFENTWE